MNTDISLSIEHAVVCGSAADIACAVRAHPCAVLLPEQQLEDLTTDALWELVRFVTDAEITSSGGVR